MAVCTAMALTCAHDHRLLFPAKTLTGCRLLLVTALCCAALLPHGDTVTAVHTTSGDSGPPTNSLSPQQIASIRTFINSICRCRNIPALTLSVVNKTHPLMEEGFGFSNVDAQVPVTADTLFAIGSTTKAFTVTLLARLIEKHQFSFTWDTPLHEYMGDDFQLYTEELTRETTLRDLLSHRTGIPGYFVQLMAGLPPDVTRADLVRRLRYFPPEYPFRTKFIYNNYMYTLAGHVAEFVEERDWEELNTEYIFVPLNMTSSRYVRDVTTGTDFALPYTWEGGRFVPVGTGSMHQADVAGPAGNIMSNARDMSRWLQLHLAKGLAPSGERVVSADLLQSTYEAAMATPAALSDRDLFKPRYPVSDVMVSYDLAWMTSYYRGYKRIWHSGGISTHKTQVWLYPDLDIGMFTSISGPPTSEATVALMLILQYISDLLMGESPWINDTTACTFPSPWEEPRPPYTQLWPVDLPGKPYSDFTGTFKHPGFCDVTVTHNTSTNRLVLSMGLYLTADLTYNRSADTFYTKFTGELWYLPEKIPVRFKHSLPGGEIDILELPLHSPYETATPVRFTRRASESSHGSSFTACSSAATARTTSPTRFVPYPMITAAILSLLLIWSRDTICLPVA